MLKIKTCWWFWGMIIPCLLIGFIYGFNSSIDISKHDTYYVVPTFLISVLGSLTFFISGCGYVFQKLNFNRILILIHFLSTLFGFFLISAPVAFVKLNFKPKTNKSIKFDPYYVYQQEVNLAMEIGFYLLLFGVITYLINLGIAIFKNKT